MTQGTNVNIYGELKKQQVCSSMDRVILCDQFDLEGFQLGLNSKRLSVFKIIKQYANVLIMAQDEVKFKLRETQLGT